MRIGIDVDGVLASFNDAYIPRIIAVTGRDLFPPRPFDIEEWEYPTRYGYTDSELATVWGGIKADPNFWVSLDPYPTALDDLATLWVARFERHHDVYFITARPGFRAQLQTIQWLEALGMSRPQVLLSSHKHLCAQALGLDAYIDDRVENVELVRDVHWHNQPPFCRTFVLDRTWNQGHIPGVERVNSVTAMLKTLDI